MARRWFPRLVMALSLLFAMIAAPSVPASAGGVVRGGDLIQTSFGGRCMVAFTVAGVGEPFSGFLTAGHCVSAGEPVYTLGGALLGYVTASSYPGDDFALVRLVAGWTPLGEVRVNSTTTIPIKGSVEAPVGARVCRVGSTTGWHCGIVQAKNQTIAYPDGTLYGLTRTSVCAEPGDTSGPFLAGNQAQGITSGAVGNCTFGGSSYFQPVNEALGRYGVRLLTA